MDAAAGDKGRRGQGIETRGFRVSDWRYSRGVRVRLCAATLSALPVLFGCSSEDTQATGTGGAGASGGGGGSATGGAAGAGGGGGTPGGGGSAGTGGISTGGASGASGSGGIAGNAGGVFRPFKPSSYWNKKFPASAPIDKNNGVYLADAANPAVSDAYLRLTGAPGSAQSFAAPLVWSQATDPLYAITPSKYGVPIDVRIPIGATPQSGSDGELWIYELSANRMVVLWQAVFASGNWSAASTTRYMIDSNGLEKNAAGSDEPMNFGHRGVPPSAQLVRVDEVKAGAVEHRLECYWHATGRPDATTPWYYWPMVGYEPAKGGIVPEGIVIRIKAGLDLSKKGLSPAALVIATALQQYGCMIGDNAGGNGNRLKLERDEPAWQALDPALDADSLSAVPWSDWEFVEGGYDPP